MASKKASGSTKNGRDSKSKRLGVKCFTGQPVLPGAILVRQRGSVFLPGRNVGRGRDFTVYSRIAGRVKFERFRRDKKKISVIPQVEKTVSASPSTGAS